MKTGCFRWMVSRRILIDSKMILSRREEVLILDVIQFRYSDSGVRSMVVSCFSSYSV